MSNLLTKLEKYILYALIFLFPIAVASISPNPFVVPKLTVLGFGVGLLLLVRAVRVIREGRLDFAVGSYDFPVLLLALAYLISTITRTPNKMEALLLPGTTTLFLGASLLYFLLNQHQEIKGKLAKLLFASSTVYSLFTLLAFARVFEKIPQLPAVFRATTFSPEGGYLPSAIFLLALLPVGITLILSEKEPSRKALWGVSSAIIVLGLAVSIFNILPGRPLSPRFPSYATSWSIAVDALKENPLFGMGPGNYLTAYNRFRPIEVNQTELWPVKFATGSNFYLTALTETGMLGLAGIILMLLSVYRSLKLSIKSRLSETKISLLILILATLVFPASALIIALIFIFLSMVSNVRKTTLALTTQAQDESPQNVTSKLPALLVTVPIIIAVLLFFYNAGRVLAAEHKFTRALNSLVRNEATQTYDTMREAIALNPRVDRYHATFSRVNLALANALAQQEEVTDQDRQNIAVLVQQAINEAKLAVALNPLRSGNWEVLGQTYRAIMALAQGADAFAIQSYTNAVSLDPLNPNLRISLGGIFYATGDFDSAIRVFELATLAKADHANARYNLAFALREDGQLDRAIQEMTIVLSLIDRQSQDYQVASEALNDLQERRAEATAQAGEELTPPQEAEEPLLEPPLDLPEGSEPPESPISPTPTPEEGEEEGSFDLSPTPTP